MSEDAEDEEDAHCLLDIEEGRHARAHALT